MGRKLGADLFDCQYGLMSYVGSSLSLFTCLVTTPRSFVIYEQVKFKNLDKFVR
ncbi:unnamed protein product [Brassica rapa subsp. narinosa]